MRIIFWIILTPASIIGGMFSFGIFIDIIPILLIFFLTWGALFVGFKGYLIKSVTSIWETNVDSQTLSKCAKVWKESRKYTTGFSFLSIFLHTIIMLRDAEDMSTVGPFASVLLWSISYALFWGFVVAGPIKNLLESKQTSNDRDLMVG